jgi:hypothetical protein
MRYAVTHSLRLVADSRVGFALIRRLAFGNTKLCFCPDW